MSQPKIDDLLKDPDFQGLGKEDQDNLKAEFFQAHVESDQEFRSLSDQDKQSFLKEFFSYGLQNQALPEDVKPKPININPEIKTASEIGKGVVRGFEGIAAGVGGTMKWIGDNLADQTPTKFKTTSGQEIEITKNPNSIGAKIGRKLQEYGETAHDFWIKEASEGAAAPDPELFRGSFMENPSFTRAASLIAEAVPSLAYATAITFATKNPMAGASALGLIQGSDDYLEARKAGKSLKASNVVGGLSAAGTAILENIPLTGFLRRASKKAASGAINRGIEIAKDAFAGAVQEGGEEAAQQLWTNLVAKLGYDKTRKLAEGMVESIIAGAGSGGIIGGFTSGKGLETDIDIDDAKEKGITDEQINAAKDHIFNQMMSHADVIEGVLSKSAKRISGSVKQITERERNLLPADVRPADIEINQPEESAPKPEFSSVKENIKKQVSDLSDAGELPQPQSAEETPMSIILREIADEINAGQPGRRFSTETQDGERVSGGEASSFPDYFKNKGYTKAETIRIINKALSSSPLTPRQISILEDLIQGKIDAVKKEIEVYERLGKEQTFEEDAEPQEEASDIGAGESGVDSQAIESGEDVFGEGPIPVEKEGPKPDPVSTLPEFKDFDSLDEWVLSRADAYGGMNAYKKTEEYRGLKPQIEKRINDLASSKKKDPLYVQPEMPNKPLRPSKDQNEIDLMGEKERVVKEAEKRQKDLFGDSVSEPDQVYADPPFYSSVERVVRLSLPEKSSAEQAMNTIKNAPGVKQEEIEWLGLDEFLKGTQRVEKQELLDFIRSNQVQIKEVQKGQIVNDRARQQAILTTTNKRDVASAKLAQKGIKIEQDVGGMPGDVLVGDLETGKIIDIDEGTPKEVIELVDQFSDAEKELDDLESGSPGRPGVKFSNYQIPGGENYREVLLTIPSEFETLRNKLTDRYGLQRGAGLEGKLTDAEFKKLMSLNEGFRSSHWDEPNVLAHFRLNERQTEKGKTLFIEEIQSDWHQKGRDQGYGFKQKRGVKEDENVWVVYNGEGKFGDVSKSLASNAEQAQRYADAHPEIYKFNSIQEGVADAPFKKTWHELALKRILRMAVEEGYDAIAWTTGEQQNERYDLSKQVDEILYRENELGSYDVLAEKDGRNLFFHTLKKEDLTNFVGKDVADKIIIGEGVEGQKSSSYQGEYKKLSGVDLKVGGAGMKGFYDQIIPSFLNKYTKKWGGRVSSSNIKSERDLAEGYFPEKVDGTWEVLDRNQDNKTIASFETRDEAQAFISAESKKESSEKVHSLEITPAMRDSVMRGQAIFDPKQPYLPGMSEGGTLKTEAEVAYENKEDQEKSLQKIISEIQDKHTSQNIRRAGIVRDLQEVKSVNFSGRKISGPDDLAQLHQVFRSPAIETFVYYVIKSDGTIFTNKAISSGMVDQAIIPDDIHDRMYVDLMAAGDDAQLIIAHNHPSGRTNASQEDMVLTQRIRKAFPQSFKGHLIIDHEEYLWIGESLDSSVRKFRIDDENGRWREDVKQFIRDPDSLAVFFSDALRGKRNLHIPFLDKGNGIVAYEVMNPFSLGSELFRSIVEAKKRYAATAYVLMGDEETIAKIKGGKKDGGVFPQGILDILTVESESGAISDKSVGVEIKTTRNTSVMEPGSEYGSNARQAGVENPDLVARLSKKMGGLEFIKAVESPELVRLAKELSGKNVQLNSRFIESLGRFMHLDGPGGRGWIELSKHIFKDPKLAQGILAHEIGHLFDWLPDETLKRGNILGRIGSLLDYRKSLLPRTPEELASMLSDKDRARIRREAEKIANSEKRGEESKDKSDPSNQFDPDLILGIWNSVEQSGIPPVLMNYVKGLSADGKKNIVKSALEAKKEGKPVTIEDIKQMNSDYFKDPQGVYEIYRELLKKEILKRKLYEEEVIREELKNLTRWWHPFDEASQTNPLTGQQSSYVKYRFSSRELYAEFISVLLNAPAKAKQVAPTAYEAFWNHIGEKEEVLDALLKTQSLIQGDNDELLRQRESDIKGMFEKSEQMFRARQLRYEKAKKNIWFMVKNAFWDKNNSILDLRGPASKSSIIDPGIDPKYILEKREFVSAAVRSYLEKLEPVYKQISEKKLKSDISLYIFAKRIMGDRAELANPLGHNPKTAGEQLEFLKKQKPEQFADVERLFGDIQGWFKSEIVPLMKDVYTPEQIKKASESDVYAPFRVIDFMKDYVSSGMMPQEGTLRDVGDLFTALVMKSASMISAASKNDIKKRMGNFLLQNPSLSSMLAARITQYPGVFKIENAPDKTMGTISWREAGKWRAYHVEKWIADSFNGDNNNFFVLNGMLEKLSGSQLARPMWITFNLSFQAANLFRDFFRAWKSHPKMTLGSVLQNYAKAFPHAVAKVKGQYDELTNEMQRNGVIGFTLNDLILNESAEDQELERFLERYDIIAKKESKIKNIPGIKQLSDILDGIRFIGDIIETVPKVAGYTALNSLPQERREYITRNLIGTPNYKRGGSLKQIYNPIFIFSNVIKEGWRGAIEMSIQDKELRGQYWKKTVALNLMSKLFLAAMLYGLFGRDKEERYKFKQMAEKMTEYDKTNSIVVPLGINGKGEVSYLRLPQDEDGRFIGALFWKMITNAADPEAMLKEIFSLTANQVPQTAPAFKMAGGWTEFLRGISPRDDWRGRDIVSRDQMAAGGWNAFEPMILWTLSNTGLASFTSYDRLKDQGMRKTALALTPIINRFYRETNYGEQEKYYKAAEKIQKNEAKERLSRREAVAEDEHRAISESTGKDKAKARDVAAKNKAKSSDSPLTRALSSASSNEQKRAMIKAAFDEFKDAKELRSYLSDAAKLKLISSELAGNVMRDFNSSK